MPRNWTVWGQRKPHSKLVRRCCSDPSRTRCPHSSRHPAHPGRTGLQTIKPSRLTQAPRNTGAYSNDWKCEGRASLLWKCMAASQDRLQTHRYPCCQSHDSEQTANVGLGSGSRVGVTIRAKFRARSHSTRHLQGWAQLGGTLHCSSCRRMRVGAGGLRPVQRTRDVSRASSNAILCQLAILKGRNLHCCDRAKLASEAHANRRL